MIWRCVESKSGPWTPTTFHRANLSLQLMDIVGSPRPGFLLATPAACIISSASPHLCVSKLSCATWPPMHNSESPPFLSLTMAAESRKAKLANRLQHKEASDCISEFYSNHTHHSKNMTSNSGAPRVLDLVARRQTHTMNLRHKIDHENILSSFRTLTRQLESNER